MQKLPIPLSENKKIRKRIHNKLPEQKPQHTKTGKLQK